MPTRRNLLRLAGGLALMPVIGAAADRVSPDDPVAVTLQYVEDASQAARPDKMGVAGARQMCANCQFYTTPDSDRGPCTLFRNQLVAAGGWCLGWMPRP